ncbi:MAG: futalosine hydrolase [Planctomycetes bacterium]|nr:futalosine hydrolase [Planctomycetota bacterium]
MEPRKSPLGPTLVLVPTELERRPLEALGGFPGARLETCGFGPVASAARAAELLARHAPRRVLLIGIAGSFDLAAAPLGAAALFAWVQLDGVGAGAGRNYQPPSELGLPQWAGPPPIAERLELAGGGRGLLLTVCAASASPAERAERHARYPEALAEDMEAFGVALACRLAGVPLLVVRGVSNEVGMRDLGAWRVQAALEAARARVLTLLAGDPSETLL